MTTQEDLEIAYKAISAIALRGTASGAVEERARVRKVLREFEAEYLRTATDTRAVAAVVEALVKLRERIG